MHNAAIVLWCLILAKVLATDCHTISNLKNQALQALNSAESAACTRNSPTQPLFNGAVFPNTGTGYNLPPPAPVYSPPNQYALPINPNNLPHIDPETMLSMTRRRQIEDQREIDQEEQMREREDALFEKLRQLREEQTKLHAEKLRNQEAKMALADEEGKLTEAQNELVQAEHDSAAERRKKKKNLRQLLAAKKEKLRKRLIDRQKELDQQYHEELEKYRSLERESRATVTSLRGEKNDLEARNARAQTALLSAQTRIGEALGKLEETNQQINEINSAEKDLIDQTSLLRSQISNAKRLSDERTGEVDALEERVATLRKQLEELSKNKNNNQKRKGHGLSWLMKKMKGGDKEQ